MTTLTNYLKEVKEAFEKKFLTGVVGSTVKTELLLRDGNAWLFKMVWSFIVRVVTEADKRGYERGWNKKVVAHQTYEGYCCACAVDVMSIEDKIDERVKELKSKLLSALPKGYRPNDDEWKKGKYGYRVKWYGQGYNHHRSETKKAINKILR